VKRVFVLAAVASVVIGAQLRLDAGADAGAARDGGATQPGDDDLVAQGEELYLTGCVSCHGREGIGVEGNGPQLVGVGAAAVDFYVTTGRMPAVAGDDVQPQRKKPVYDRAETDALIAYIGSLGGDGPSIPEVEIDPASLALGGELYRANCASCHNASGIGGALSYGSEAPSLGEATPEQVVEVTRPSRPRRPVPSPPTSTTCSTPTIPAASPSAGSGR
jgi:quinol---cytochrome-c reductase cytochrome c subunit